VKPLGQFDTVKGVGFALDGKDVSVLSGDGTVTDRPLTCDRCGRFEPASNSADLGSGPTPPPKSPMVPSSVGDRTSEPQSYE